MIHVINLAGNFTNNGTVAFFQNATNFVILNFIGTSKLISGAGSWSLYNVTLNKDDKNSTLTNEAAKFKIVTGGTFDFAVGKYIHNPFDNDPVNKDSLIINPTTNFILNANVHIVAKSGVLHFAASNTHIILRGTLEVAGGKVYIGKSNTAAGTSASGIQYDVNSTTIPSLIVSAGTLNVYQGINFLAAPTEEPFIFSMSGDTINLNIGTASDRGALHITNLVNSSFTMTGGLINIQKPSTGSDFNINGSNKTTDVRNVVSSGAATVQFGTDKNVNLAFDFTPYSHSTLPNLKVVSSGTGKNPSTLRPSALGDFKVVGIFIGNLTYFDIMNVDYNLTTPDTRTITIEGTLDGTAGGYAWYDENNRGEKEQPYFNRRQGTVVFTGNGLIRAGIRVDQPWINYFYNLSLAYSNKTITASKGFGVSNKIIFNGGTFTKVQGSSCAIILYGAEPIIFNAATIISVGSFNLSYSGIQKFAAGKYDCDIVISGMNTKAEMIGDVEINGSLIINGDWVDGRSTSFYPKNFKLTIRKDLAIGEAGGPTPGVHTLQPYDDANTAGSPQIIVDGNFNVFDNGYVNASAGTISIGGNFNNVRTGDFFNEGTSTVSFTSATNSFITSSATGGETFYKLIIDKTAPATVTLHNITKVDQGGLTLTSGNIISSDMNPLVINSGSSVTGARNSSFVDGPVRKYGPGAFTFPVGKEGIYRPISIEPNGTATNYFTAEYFKKNPLVDYPKANGNPLNNAEPLYSISQLEHWILNRSSGSTASTRVTLYWGPSFDSGVKNTNDLRVARYSGQDWQNHGGKVTGDASNGYITSDVITSFSPFALASTTSNNPMPVEFLKFTGKFLGQSNLLEWSTATEKNNAYFTVEKSTDQVHFEEVGVIEGAGSSNSVKNYFLEDKAITNGLTYYRIKQTDFNGDFNYSPIISVKALLERQYLISPNPFAHTFMISANSKDLDGAVVEVENSNLNKVFHQIIDGNKTKVEINLGNASSGVYFVTITSKKGLFRYKIVKI